MRIYGQTMEKCLDYWITWMKKTFTILCVFYAVNQGPTAESGSIPRFTNTTTRVTAVEGSEAILQCGVENLGTKTVGWRKLPYKVPITVGKDQFLELQRFKLYQIPHLGEWNLHIKNAQIFDSGTYECQVSSKQHKIRRNVTLKIIASKPGISIVGTEFVEKGGTIHHVCNVSSQEDPPQSVDWFKDGARLETSYARNVFIKQQVSLSQKRLISTLDIKKAKMTDAGVYVCRASKLMATRIKVDVLNAETYNSKRETAQSGGSIIQLGNSTERPLSHTCWYCLTILILVWHTSIQRLQEFLHQS